MQVICKWWLLMKNIKNEPTFPDYTDSILNLSCSIQKHFGDEPLHETLPQVDEILSHGHKHVVVILLDGLSMEVLQYNLSYRDFLRRHLLTDYSSVFPPTTTTSTTSFVTGKSPIEHGLLDSDIYSEQTIFDKINKAGQGKAFAVMPFDAYGFKGHENLNDWFKEIRKTTQQEGRTFTYAYWPEPDSLLHELGNGSRDVEKVIRELNNGIIDLCDSTEDTVYFITADHGHMSIQNLFLEEDYPDLCKMLERPVSMEPRAISFYVKPEYKDDFRRKFLDCFEKDYMLLTKEEVLEKQLLGPGEPHSNLTGIGDYVAIATSYKTLLWNKKCNQFRSHHAGLTKNEMRIPLIWFENKPKKSPWIAYYTILGMVVAFIFWILFH